MKRSYSVTEVDVVEVHINDVVTRVNLIDALPGDIARLLSGAQTIQSLRIVDTSEEGGRGQAVLEAIANAERRKPYTISSISICVSANPGAYAKSFSGLLARISGLRSLHYMSQDMASLEESRQLIKSIASVQSCNEAGLQGLHLSGLSVDAQSLRLLANLVRRHSQGLRELALVQVLAISDDYSVYYAMHQVGLAVRSCRELKDLCLNDIGCDHEPKPARLSEQDPNIWPYEATGDLDSMFALVKYDYRSKTSQSDVLAGFFLSHAMPPKSLAGPPGGAKEDGRHGGPRPGASIMYEYIKQASAGATAAESTSETESDWSTTKADTSDQPPPFSFYTLHLQAIKLGEGLVRCMVQAGREGAFTNLSAVEFLYIAAEDACFGAVIKALAGSHSTRLRRRQLRRICFQRCKLGEETTKAVLDLVSPPKTSGGGPSRSRQASKTSEECVAIGVSSGQPSGSQVAGLRELLVDTAFCGAHRDASTNGCICTRLWSCQSLEKLAIVGWVGDGVSNHGNSIPMIFQPGSQLQALSLSFNLMGWSLGVFVAAIEGLLPEQLRVLRLKGVAESEGSIIADLLRRSDVIEELDLEDSYNLHDAGGIPIAHALMWPPPSLHERVEAVPARCNATLTRLNLSNCGLSAAGHAQFARVVETNQAIRHLDISTGMRADYPALPWYRAIPKNCSLMSFAVGRMKSVWSPDSRGSLETTVWTQHPSMLCLGLPWQSERCELSDPHSSRQDKAIRWLDEADATHTRHRAAIALNPTTVQRGARLSSDSSLTSPARAVCMLRLIYQGERLPAERVASYTQRAFVSCSPPPARHEIDLLVQALVDDRGARQRLLYTSEMGTRWSAIPNAESYIIVVETGASYAEAEIWARKKRGLGSHYGLGCLPRQLAMRLTCLALRKVSLPGVVDSSTPGLRERTVRLQQVKGSLCFARVLLWRRAHDAHRDSVQVFKAASEGRPLELAKRLRLGRLAGGIDRVRFVDGVSKTPLDAARDGDHEECVRVLMQAGAN